jgi:ABC-type transport system substrate-binding protein
MRRVKTVAIFLVMFILVSALYGCNSQKDSMIVGVDFASNKHWPLNPFQSIGRNDVNLLVYDSLFTIDEHGFAEPSVVKSFVQEGSLYKITLNEGIKFHNGKEMTSVDVADTLLRIIYVHGINEDNIPELFSALEKIDLVSKYELVFTLKNPDMMFWNKLTFGITPAYNPNQVEDKPWPATIEKKNLSLVYINVNEDGHNGQVITDAYTKSTPVGSGPWQFEKESYDTFITSNKPTKVELIKNEDYWKGNVGIEKVILQKVENGVYSVNSYLLAKSIDISPWTSPLWGDLSQMEYYSKFKTAEHLSLIQYLPSTTTQTIYFTKTNDTI